MGKYLSIIKTQQVHVTRSVYIHVEVKISTVFVWLTFDIAKKKDLFLKKG
jgi:hypothetical protein